MDPNYRHKLYQLYLKKVGRSLEGSGLTKLICLYCNIDYGRILNRADTGPICQECLWKKGIIEDEAYIHKIVPAPSRNREKLIGLICSDCRIKIPDETEPKRIKWRGEYLCRSCKGRRIAQGKKNQRKK